MRSNQLLPTLMLAAMAVGCSADAGEEQPVPPVTLGPVDGRELPATDLERVLAGSVAPDFSLISLAGPVVTLSEYRGRRNVILVFYRGWW
jgi:hypothetical protein